VLNFVEIVIGHAAMQLPEGYQTRQAPADLNKLISS
jgi:hypothetical protein